MKTRVAVIDDDALLRDALTEYLDSNGFETLSLDGGAALRAQLDSQPPDLVILDLVMPEEDGLSILRWLRGVSDVPVIMLTSNDTTTDRVVGLELGADDYIAKPADYRELLARVRSVLRRRTTQITTQPAPPISCTVDTSETTAETLDKDDFLESVKSALNAFHETHELQSNPLLESVAVRSRAEGDESRLSALRHLIRDANARLKENHKTETAARVIHRTYIEPARSQQLAADALGMGYSTYRRQLSRARELLAAELWQYEEAQRS
ncbi:MAG: response regulator transcription factor [Oceanococcus sp.]